MTNTTNRKWRLKDRLEPLTTEEQELASEYHNIVFEVLHACDISDISDYYDIAIMYYLKAIKKWCNTPALWERYEIRQILFAEVKGGVTGRRAAEIKRAKKLLSLDGPIPVTRSNTESQMTLADIVPSSHNDFDRIFEGEDDLDTDREQVKTVLVQKIKAALSSQQKNIAEMYADKAEISQIAARLDIAPGTVGSTMHAVREKVEKMDLPEVKMLYGSAIVENPFHHRSKQPISDKERTVLEKHPDCLSGKQYILFSLYARGLKQKEIAKLTGISASDIGSRISKIRKMIAAMTIPA